MPAGARIVRALISCALVASVLVLAPAARAVAPVAVGFDDPVSLDTGSTVDAVTVADVSGDALTDLIAGNTGAVSEAADYTLQVFVQQLDGSLAAPVAYSPTKLEGDQPALVTAAGDLDDDGDTDIATSTAQGLDVFLQDGGVLTGPTSYPAPSGTVHDVQVADLNADGRDDVVYTIDQDASPGDYQIVHRYQNETGTLDGAVVLGTYTGGVSVAVGDTTGDGRPDVVVEDGSTDGIHVLEQQDDLTFSEQTDARATNVEVAVFADVTGDALDDLVLVDPAEGALDVMAAAAGGPLADPVPHPIDGVPTLRSLEAADINGDGTTDLIAISSTASYLWLQDDAGSLVGPCSAPTPLTGGVDGGKEITAVGDVDGDDVPDLAGGGGQLGASLATGFAPGESYPTSLSLGGATPSVTIGTTLQLSGGFDFDHGCLEPGAEVEIWRATGDADAVQIGTAPIEVSGTGYTFAFDDTPPVAGRYRYHVTFAGAGVLGGSESLTTTVDVVKHSSTLRLDVSDPTLRFGQTTRLVATLQGPSKGRVSFYAEVDGVKRRVDTVRVNAKGRALLDVKPSFHTTYSARFAGTAAYAAASSREKRVTVASVVHGVMAKYPRTVGGIPVYDCCRAWFHTWVEPTKAGQQVRVSVQYWNGVAWKNLRADDDTFKLNSTGAALIFLDILGGAGFRFRAHATWASDGLNGGGSSPWVRFKLD